VTTQRAIPIDPAANPAATPTSVVSNGALNGHHSTLETKPESIQPGSPAAMPPHTPPRRKRTLYDRIDTFVSKLSTRNNFWHRVCSLIWLPFAFRSGIRMKRIDRTTFTAVLPFRRFNRNWYNAMAGAALLGNAEIAGGMYVFGVCGGDYTVVCKHLEYKFLRPCFGPALYRITPRGDLDTLLAPKGEFNLTIDMDVVQQIHKPGGKERRVGKCKATFHVTPKLAPRKPRRELEEAEAVGESPTQPSA